MEATTTEGNLSLQDPKSHPGPPVPNMAHIVDRLDMPSSYKDNKNRVSIWYFVIAPIRLSDAEVAYRSAATTSESNWRLLQPCMLET